MRISWKQLKHLPVRSHSGITLGRVSDLVFDADSHHIVQYIVHAYPLPTRTYLIHESQVEAFTDQAMIVQDGMSSVSTSVPGTPVFDAPGDSVALREEG